MRGGGAFIGSNAFNPARPQFFDDEQHMARAAAKAKEEGLFPPEAEIARRLSQSAAEWAAIAIVLEREGLPRVDPLMGGRFWPAVQQFFRRRYGLSTIEASNPDGTENLDAL